MKLINNKSVYFVKDKEINECPVNASTNKMCKSDETDIAAIALQKTDDWHKLIDFVEGVEKAKVNRTFFCCVTADRFILLEDHVCVFVYDFSKKPYIGLMLNQICGRNVLITNATDDASVCQHKIKSVDHDGFFVYSTAFNNYQVVLNSAIMRLLLDSAEVVHEGRTYGRHFKIDTGRGTHHKIRDIVAPDKALLPDLQDLNRILCATYAKRNSSFQVAYKTGKSVIDNARPHIKHKYIFKLDIHDFFPSCKREMVKKYINFLFQNCPGNVEAISDVLDIITYDGALAIGNPCSGVLANTIISKMVMYIHSAAQKAGMAFTVYADDMTLSSDTFISKDFAQDLFNTAADKYGLSGFFKLNEKKSFGCSGCNREVTGVVINDDNKMTTKRSMYMRVRQNLHYLSEGKTTYTESVKLLDYKLANKLITKEEYNSMNGKTVPINMQTLVGQLSYMSMVDHSGKLKALVKRYRPTIKKYHLMSDKTLSNIKA